MASTVITVTGMTCSHCVAAVQSEIGKLPGVSGVDINLATGSVTVTAEQLPEAGALRAAVAAAGYELASRGGVQPS
jgi:copper chaperone